MTFMTNCQESDVKISHASSEPEVEEVIDMDMFSMFFYQAKLIMKDILFEILCIYIYIYLMLFVVDNLHA